jgi:hypothetical protein
MGLDMYLYKAKKMTDEEAASLHLCNTDELEESEYVVLPTGQENMFSSIMDYGKKIRAKETRIDIKKIKEDYKIPKNADIVGSYFSVDEISYTFQWNDEIKKIRLPITTEILYEDIDKIKKDYGIPDDFTFLRERKYRENKILSFSRKSKATVKLSNKDYTSYLYKAEADFWVFKMSEVGYWRKAYDLQNMIYEEFNDQIENCGYYKLSSPFMLKLNFYQVDHDQETFEPLSDDECYVYHEWY